MWYMTEQRLGHVAHNRSRTRPVDSSEAARVLVLEYKRFCLVAELYRASIVSTRRKALGAATAKDRA